MRLFHVHVYLPSRQDAQPPVPWGSFMRHSRFRKQKGQQREKAFSSVLRAVVAEAERSRGLF